ncbi:hypothetical protein ACNHKD_05775 [Methylocystis sp. JAN1]|uniref:hypothetical protein n=1 Tax=Methylocystis sp. JAN1 TaxID=3397211 RepID=UPI003FA233C4
MPIAAAEPARIEKMIAEQGKLCFARVYDAAHLKAHPQQKVERFFFMIGKNKVSTFWEDPNLRHSEASPNKHAAGDAQDPENNSTHVAALVTLRGMKKPENVSGWCGRAGEAGGKGRIECGGECDRHIGAIRSDDGTHLVLDGVEWGLLTDAEADEAAQAAAKLGPDDRSFRLEQRPIEECIAEANKTNPPYARLGAPLRERLKADAPFCFGRDYSPEHLASHPQQVTASIRVSRNAKAIEADRAKNLLPDWPDGASLAATVTTRKNGKPQTLSYSCAPYEDQWECTAALCDSKKGDCTPAERDNARVAGCDGDYSRAIYLRRGEKAFMMLGNPNMGLPLEPYCGPDRKTVSDDKVYRLEPMLLSACEGG